MRKSELRNGMLVQCRDTEWCVVIKGVKEHYENSDFFIEISTGDNLVINRYNEDLTHVKGTEYDVIKVAECNYVGNVFRGIKEGKAVEDYCGFRVLWERSNPKKALLKSLVDKLSEQLRKVQEELEALR